MNDWTDIIGEQLSNMSGTLPADDWKVLQQKYSSSRRRARRAAALRWAGRLVAAAAAVLLIIFISLPKENTPHTTLIAEEIPHSHVILPDSCTMSADNYTLPSDNCSLPQEELPPHMGTSKTTESVQDKPSGQESESTCSTPEVTTDMSADAASGTISKTASETASEAASETVSDAPVKIQSSTTPEKATDEVDKTGKENKYLALDNLLEEPERNKNRRKISIGISGAISGTMDIGEKVDMSYGSVTEPADSSYHTKPAAYKYKSDRYDHEMPVSFGISARFHLNDVLAVSTGINYTKYESKRTGYIQGHKQSSMQKVHYIGIPVRFDLILAESKNLSLYLGAGIQADKCLWATAWGERLHEKELLWSATCAAGLQVNLTPSSSIYLEPELSRALNTGSLQTYRSEESSTVSIRAGIRFTLK